MLERLDGMALIRQFAQLDVLVAVHGAGITNIIFMMPNSFVVELFPPFWQYGCYRRLASNVGVLYAKETAIGEKGPECARNEKKFDLIYKANVKAIEEAAKKGVNKSGIFNPSLLKPGMILQLPK